MNKCNKFLLAKCLLGTSILTLFCSPAVSQEIDVAILDSELSAVNYRSFSMQEMKASPAYSELVSKASKSDLFQLVERSRSPIVSLSVFHIIREKYPESAPEVALSILSRSDSPLSLIFVTLRDTLEAVNSQQLRRLLGTLSAESYVDAKSASVLVSFLPFEELKNWFHSEDSDGASIGLRGVVADSIAGDLRQKGVPIDGKLLSTIKSLKTSNRYMRVIYSVYAPEDDEGYSECIKTLLEDPDLSNTELLTIIANKTKYISASIDVDMLAVTPDNRDLIEEYLQMFMKVTESKP